MVNGVTVLGAEELADGTMLLAIEDFLFHHREEIEQASELLTKMSEMFATSPEEGNIHKIEIIMEKK